MSHCPYRAAVRGQYAGSTAAKHSAAKQTAEQAAIGAHRTLAGLYADRSAALFGGFRAGLRVSFRGRLRGPLRICLRCVATRGLYRLKQRTEVVHVPVALFQKLSVIEVETCLLDTALCQSGL